jgi:putative cell wall-binding protein
LAGAIAGPILLTDSDELYAGTKAELERLGVSQVYVVGGSNVVSENVYDQIATMPGIAGNVTRIGGSTRYETAEMVANTVADLKGTPCDQVFLVSGENFPDALSVSAIAAARQIPILLTSQKSLDSNAKRFIDEQAVGEAVIVGGTAAVSEHVESEMLAIEGVSVERIAGQTRYDTALNVYSRLEDKWQLSPSMLAIASGENFPDALTGGAATGGQDGFMLLSHTAELRPSVHQPIAQSDAQIWKVLIFGGEKAVSKDLELSIQGLL